VFDPWLEYRLRLAEKRGVLSGGRSLNRVQERAIELLLVMQIMRERAEKDDAIKQALISSDKMLYPVLYPSPDEANVTEESVEEDLADTGQSQWRFDQEVDPKEAEEILASLLAQGGGTLKMKDLDKEGDGDGW